MFGSLKKLPDNFFVALSKAPKYQISYVQQARRTLLLSKVIIGQNKRDLRNFFDESSCKVVRPVIQIESGLILQTSSQK